MQWQQPQVVATVQLPNGQIGQLIAPTGGQFWSPNAIDLQQLSMAVAAATGTMPQTLSLPINNTQSINIQSQTSLGGGNQNSNIHSNNNNTSQTHIDTQPIDHTSNTGTSTAASNETSNTSNLQQSNSNQQSFQHIHHQATTISNNNNNNNSNSNENTSNVLSGDASSNADNGLNNNSNNTSTSNNFNQQQQFMTTLQLPNNQLAHVIDRSSQLNQILSGGPISLSQLTALAQQGLIQLSLINDQDLVANSTNTLATTSSTTHQPNNPLGVTQITALLDNTTATLQQQQPSTIIASNENIININNARRDSSEVSKWNQAILAPETNLPIGLQQVQANSHNQQQSSLSPNVSLSNSTIGTNTTLHRNNNASSTNNSNSCQYSTDSIKHATSASITQSSQQQSQRKLKRLACTCPNCRDGDNNRTSGNDKKKQHICHFTDCGKVYGKTSHLRAHLRWHSGERPYVCGWPFCGKKFTRSDELQRHRRTHTGEKRFQCPECLKKFMRSDHLSKHLKTHLSSKKFSSNQQVQLIRQHSPGAMSTMMSIPQQQEQQQQQHENNMIDANALDALNDTDLEQQHQLSDHNTMDLKVNIASNN